MVLKIKNPSKNISRPPSCILWNRRNYSTISISRNSL